MKEKREPGRIVWYGGRERENQKKNQSVTTEKTWVRKGVYQIGHMHLFVCSAKLYPLGPLWGWAEERGPCSRPTALGCQRPFGPTLSFCREKRLSPRKET